MKSLLWLIAVGTLCYAVAGGRSTADVQALVIVGSTHGYLSPCGCVKPMSGGIRRRITAIKSLSIESRTTILDNGGLVSGNFRQDELKAETHADPALAE